jgi:hypothetical protein
MYNMIEGMVGIQRSWKALPNPKPAAPCGSQFSSAMAPKDTFLVVCCILKLMTLKRRGLLSTGEVRERFMELGSSLGILIILEGGDMTRGCGTGGVCYGKGCSPPG